MEKKIEVEMGSGNVFADLGLPNPEERQLKSYLMMKIDDALRKKRLTKKQAANKLDLTPECLSELLEGAPSQYSVAQLVGYLRCLGYDVQLFAEVTERKTEAKKTVHEKEREAVAA
jgi:predicted XRE-type DNA-binding protein